MVKLVVIADDFTGALDTGVQFAKRSIPTRVVPDAQMKFEGSIPEESVLVMNTESRHMDGDIAYRRVASVVQQCADAGVRYFYKKTDSTLRGNIGSELSALFAHGDCDEVIFVPAYPKMGRTTVDGHQYIHGIPIHKSTFRRDPREPLTDSHIPGIIRKQTVIPTTVIKRPYMVDADRTVKRIVICDAVTDDDMYMIGTSVKSAHRLRFLAGCAGFAEWLPDLLCLETNAASVHRYPLPLLVVCGSLQETSVRQVRYAEERGMNGITVTGMQLVDETYPGTTEGQRWIGRLSSLLREGEDVFVRTSTIPAGGSSTSEISRNAKKATNFRVCRLDDICTPSPRNDCSSKKWFNNIRKKIPSPT